MFGGNRRARYSTTALALLIVASFLFLSIATHLGQQDYNQRQQQTASPEQGRGAYDNRDTQNWVPPWPISVYRDTLAQWVMAFFAFAATGVSIYAVRVLGRTLEATNEAVRSADEAVTVTREIGIAQTAAYLRLERPMIEFRGHHTPPDPDGLVYPRLYAKVVNSGQTPAFDCKIAAEISYRSEITGNRTAQMSFPTGEIGDRALPHVIVDVPARGDDEVRLVSREMALRPDELGAPSGSIVIDVKVTMSYRDYRRSCIGPIDQTFTGQLGIDPSAGPRSFVLTRVS